MSRRNGNADPALKSLFDKTDGFAESGLPPSLGTGKIVRTATKKGILLCSLVLRLKEDRKFRQPLIRDAVYLWFNYGEKTVFEREGKKAFSLEKGNYRVCFGKEEAETLSFVKEKDYQLKGICLTSGLLKEIYSLYFENREETESMCALDEDRVFSNSARMDRLFFDLRDYGAYRNGPGMLYLDSRIQELVALCMADLLDTEITEGKHFASGHENIKVMEEAARIIDEQIADLPSRPEMAKKLGMSSSAFGKYFREYFGTSVHAYIINRRLEKAAMLLIEADMPIKEVAATVGYSKSSNLSAAFKRKFGVLPKDYRKHYYE